MEDVRPPHKVTDYSSSSDDSGTTDDEDDEEVDQEGGESTSGPEDSRGGWELQSHNAVSFIIAAITILSLTALIIRPIDLPD